MKIIFSNLLLKNIWVFINIKYDGLCVWVCQIGLAQVFLAINDGFNIIIVKNYYILFTSLLPDKSFDNND